MTSTDTSPGNGLGRIIGSLVAAVVPIPALLWAQGALADRVPDEMPIHWGQSGGADATIATESLASGTLTGALVRVVIAAIGYVLVRQPLVVRRVVIAVGGSVAAVSASTWISAAIAVVDRTEAMGAPMGPGVMLTMVSIVYGLLPALLLTQPSASR